MSQRRPAASGGRRQNDREHDEDVYADRGRLKKSLRKHQRRSEAAPASNHFGGKGDSKRDRRCDPNAAEK